MYNNINHQPVKKSVENVSSSKLYDDFRQSYTESHSSQNSSFKSAADALSNKSNGLPDVSIVGEHLGALVSTTAQILNQFKDSAIINSKEQKISGKDPIFPKDEIIPPGAHNERRAFGITDKIEMAVAEKSEKISAAADFLKKYNKAMSSKTIDKEFLDSLQAIGKLAANDKNVQDLLSNVFKGDGIDMSIADGKIKLERREDSDGPHYERSYTALEMNLSDGKVRASFSDGGQYKLGQESHGELTPEKAGKRLFEKRSKGRPGDGVVIDY